MQCCKFVNFKLFRMKMAYKIPTCFMGLHTPAFSVFIFSPAAIIHPTYAPENASPSAHASAPLVQLLASSR